MAHQLHDLAKSSPRKMVYDIVGGKHNSLYKTDPNFWQHVNYFFDKSEYETNDRVNSDLVIE